MLIFGVDMPTVELMVFFLFVVIVIFIEIIVVIILQLYQMKENKRMMRASLEVSKLLVEIKEKELALRKLKQQ